MKIILLTLLLSFSNFALSCPILVGTWQSSKEKSMEYNSQSTELERDQRDLLNQILGYTTITYLKTEMIHHGLPPVKVNHNGTEYDFEFLEFTYPYDIVSCNDNAIIIEHKDEEFGDIQLTLNFEGQNTYWLSPETVLSKSREYFVRIAQ